MVTNIKLKTNQQNTKPLSDAEDTALWETNLFAAK